MNHWKYVGCLLFLAQGPFAVGDDLTVNVPLHLSCEWHELYLDDPATGLATLSALRYLRAVDRESHQPFDMGRPDFPVAPERLRRRFELAGAEFVFGQPLLVSFVIEVEDGSGAWMEPVGGNYRARGRDDNFLFLMRHEDGTWVSDPYAPVEVYMGGIMSRRPAQPAKPLRQWFALQQWCSVDRPGIYDLYCFHIPAADPPILGEIAALETALPEDIRSRFSVGPDRHLVDRESEARQDRYVTPSCKRVEWRKSPVAHQVPMEILNKANETWSADQTCDFAHLRLTLESGSARERRQMVERWAAVAEAGEESKARAARQAVHHIRQTDFLPELKRWLSEPNEVPLHTLAMHPAPEMWALFLEHAGPDELIGATHRMKPDRIELVMPRLIGYLEHPDDRIRRLALQRIAWLTGEDILPGWRTLGEGRPTLEEGRELGRELSAKIEELKKRRPE